MTNKLTLAGIPLEAFHVCAFFDSRDEEYDVLNPFYLQGIENGEKNIHIVDPEFMDDHRRLLAAGGIDVHNCEACGQVEIVGWPKAYLDNEGKFNKDHMLEMIDKLTSEAKDQGFSRLRIMGNMDWAFQDTPGAIDLIAYESEVNEILDRNLQPAVCVYDLAKLSGAFLMDVLRTHPLTLINGIVQENPFFTPPSVLAKEMRTRHTPALIG